MDWKLQTDLSEIDFQKENDDTMKSSRSLMFSKIGALENFAIFTILN